MTRPPQSSRATFLGGLSLLFMGLGLLLSCQPSPRTPLPQDLTAAAVGTSGPGPTTPQEPQAGLSTTPVLARQTATPSPTPPPAMVPGGWVMQGGTHPVRTVDPLAGNLNPAEQQVADLLFEGLLVPSPLDGRPEPALAEAWTFSADGMEVTFHLREGVRWHDGAPLTAGDVVRALEAARDQGGESPWWPRLEPILSVEALGEREVRVTFREVDCWAFWAVGQVPLVRRDAAGNPVGTGPFRWASEEPDGRVVLEAFPDYWSRPPYLEGWTYQPFPDAASLEQALGAGAVDVILWPREEAPASWNTSATGYTLWPLPGESYFALVFNARRPALRQPEARQALAGLVDRAALLQHVGGKGLVLDVPLPPGHWALAGDLPTAAAVEPGDSARALAAVGWEDDDGDGWREFRGQDQALAVETNADNPQRLQVALLVAEQLRAAGVPAELQAVEWGVLLTDLSRHNFDLAVLDLPFHVEPAACTLWREDTGRARKSFNWPGLGEGDLEDLRALLGAARAVPGCAPEGRAARYRDVWAWLERERPFLVLLSPARWLAADIALKGVVASPFRPWYWNLNRWYWTAEPNG